MVDAGALLRAYDDQLRTEAEIPTAASVTHLGPLLLATYAGGRGFITYRTLDGVRDLDALVSAALAHYRADPQISRVEWKTRGHDRAPGLIDALQAHDFAPDEPESIMIGEARRLDVPGAVPDGVTLRQVRDETDVRAMSAMQDLVFGDEVLPAMADALLRRLEVDDGLQLWMAEADGHVVSAGRLEPVAGTQFAGIWGGATLEAWRGQGIYRALLAARARSALAMGCTLVHSDSTEYSRPILERSGFVRVSSTTPYRWRRTTDC